MRTVSVWLAMGLLWAGCGGSQPDTTPATHDDFRAIQRHEATIDGAAPVAEELDAECQRRCSAAANVCDAARGICRIAEDTADLDVRARCRSAQSTCQRATHATGTGDGCECSP